MKKLLLTSYLILLAGTLFANVPEKEESALVDLYNSTKGASWNKTWDLSKDVSLWEGITISNGHVTEIRMLFNNLEGEIPTSIQNLKELKVLELSFNKISGNLPSSLGSLTKLEVLALNGNFLMGRIPSSLGNLKNLKQLHLSSNNLSGELPSSLDNLSNLEVFNVFQNNLSGQVPVALAKNRNMREFLVAENNFKPSNEINTILLSRSAQMDLNGSTLNPASKQIIALEVEEGN